MGGNETLDGGNVKPHPQMFLIPMGGNEREHPHADWKKWQIVPDPHGG